MRLSTLLFFFVCVSLHANDLCQYIDTKIAGARDWLEAVKDPKEAQITLANEILNAIRSRAAAVFEDRIYETGKPAEHYVNLMAVADVKGPLSKYSVHSPIPKGTEVLATDARFVIQLPDKGKKTVWDLLTPEGRTYLAEQLLLDYQRGKYDADMVGKKQNTDLKRAMDQTELLALDDPEGNPVAGVSPLLLLHMAGKRRRVGLCRHGACAMTGLLGELGISEKNIRMVAGKKTDTKDESGHIWIEVRYEDNGPWVELDPTARDLSGEDRLFGALFGAEATKNAEVYKYQRKIYEDVLVPQDIRPIPIDYSP